MTDKVFWIESSKTSCQLKWTWSKIFLQNGTTQCCWHNPHHSYTSLQDFHNTPEKIKDRETMLAGNWPAGCGYCKNIEDHGGISDRMLHNKIPNMRPVELETNPSATHIDPTVIEVIFGNTCNLSCIYCGPKLSSSWNNEVLKHGTLAVGEFYKKDYMKIDKTEQEQNISKFWTWLEEKYLSLTKLTALGGEPLLEGNTFKLIDFFDAHPNENMQLLIFTNLMVPMRMIQDVVARLQELIRQKKVGSVQISTSMEAYGASAEFIRHGVNLVDWQKNLQYIKGHPEIDLMVNGAVNCLSIKTMPDLIKTLNDMSVPLHFSGVDRVPFLEVSALPKRLFLTELEQSLAMLPDWSADRLRGIMSTLSENGDPKRIKQLKEFLDELSLRRNLNWQSVFPWLVETLDVV